MFFFCYLNFFLFVRASCFLFYVTPAWLPRFMRSHSQPLTYGAYALDNVTLLRWPTRPASISSWTFTLLGSSQPYYRVVSLASKRTVLDDIQSAIRLCQNRKSLTPQIEKVYLAISDKSCQETTLTYVSRMSIFVIRRSEESYVFFLFHWHFCFNSKKVERKRNWEELQRVAWKIFNLSVIIKM